MGLARLIGKAATGAAPIAIQRWRDDVDAKRDLQLRKYQVEDRDLAIRNSNEQAQLDRDQDAMQNQQQVALQAGGAARDQIRLDADLANADLETRRINKLIDQIDVEMESTQLDVESKRALQQLQTALAEAETPEEQSSLITRIMGFDGKERDPDYDFIEGTAIDPETAEKISTLIRVNDRAGEYDFIGSGAGSGGAAGIDLEEMKTDFLALENPDAEDIATYDSVVGEQGAARRLLAGRTQQPAASQPAQSQSQPAPQARAAQSATTGLLDMGMSRAAQPGQRLPPGEGVRRRGTMMTPADDSESSIEDVLAGYTLPGPTLGDQIAGAARNVGEYQRRARLENRENKTNMVVDQVKKIIDSTDLRPLVGMAEEDIRLALTSGKLSEKQAKVLTAYLEQSE
jgi:ribosome-associated protein YbcJ (S4-like RNA binding protein)